MNHNPDEIKNRADFIKAIKRLYVLYYKAFNAILPEEEFTAAQCMVLVVIFRQKGKKITTEKLLNTFKVSRATMSQSLKELQKKNFIRYENNPDNLRTKTIYLTEKAEKLCPTIINGLERLLSEFFSGISDEELSSSFNTLKKMNENAIYMEEHK